MNKIVMFSLATVLAVAALFIPMNHGVETKAQQSVTTNQELLNQYIDGLITKDQLANKFMFDATYQVLFMSSWGITISPFTPNSIPDEKNCVERGAAAMEYDCEWSQDVSTLCCIRVDVDNGPEAGTHVFIKACDGLPIAEPHGSGILFHYTTTASWR